MACWPALPLKVSGITSAGGGNWYLAHTNNISFLIIDRYQQRRGCPGSCTHLKVDNCCPHWDRSACSLTSLVSFCLSWGLSSHLDCRHGCLDGGFGGFMGLPLRCWFCLLSPILMLSCLGLCLLSHNTEQRCSGCHSHCCDSLLARASCQRLCSLISWSLSHCSIW